MKGDNVNTACMLCGGILVVKEHPKWVVVECSGCKSTWEGGSKEEVQSLAGYGVEFVGEPEVGARP